MTHSVLRRSRRISGALAGAAVLAALASGPVVASQGCTLTGFFLDDAVGVTCRQAKEVFHAAVHYSGDKFKHYTVHAAGRSWRCIEHVSGGGANGDFSCTSGKKWVKWHWIFG